MRLRYQSVMYHSGSAVPSLEHHYRELRSAMFHFGQQATYPQPGAFWRPAMDIHETSDAVLVKIELAGMDDESIEITIYPNAIVVAGQRHSLPPAARMLQRRTVSRASTTRCAKSAKACASAPSPLFDLNSTL